MSDYTPYTYIPIDRVTTDNCNTVVQAEDWHDNQGHRTHLVVVVSNDVDSVGIMIGTPEEARRLKNLFAKVERRLSS